MPKLMVPRTRLEAVRQAAIARARILHEMEATPAGPAQPTSTAEELAEMEACRRSFRHFLRYWKFINRETGRVLTFERLWAGQSDAVDVMASEPWAFLLKAGKLGFTELGCAYDGWVARFGQPNSLVGLFSRDLDAAKGLLRMVKFGLRKLPEWMQLPVYEGPGGDTTQSLILAGGPDDIRTIVAYSTKTTVAIDKTLTHAHVDELSHMVDPEGLWGSISTIISPEGSLHIITRGAGEGVYTAKLWCSCKNLGGDSLLHGFFAAYDQRPGRDRAWREAQAATMPAQALLYYAPQTPEEALAGDEANTYIPLPVWDRCHDPGLPPLEPGDPTPVVMGVDASVSGDMFAIVVASRRPGHPDWPAIRSCMAYRPQEETGGRIDFEKVERFIRFLCEGGCAAGHPRSLPLVGAKDVWGNPLEDCELCLNHEWTVPRLNVVQLCYDPYQFEDVAQHLTRDGIVWADAFNQGQERLVGDAVLYQRALKGELVHDGSRMLREHIGNAKVQVQGPTGADSKMRIIKAGEGKIDLAVAAAMAVKRILDLNV